MASAANQRELQRLETRSQIFDAAVSEFSRHGVADSEIAPIAEAAGVSRGSFYFHFPTKEHVLAELERREEAHMVHGLEPLLDSDNGLPDVLDAVIDAILAAEARLGPLLFQEMLALHFDPSSPEETDLGSYALARFVVTAFERAAARGEVRDDVAAEEMSATFLTGLFGMLVGFGGLGDERRRLLEQFVRLAMEGMGPR